MKGKCWFNLFEYQLVSTRHGPMLLHLTLTHAFMGKETATTLIKERGLIQDNLKKKAKIIGDDEFLCIDGMCYPMRYLKRFNADLEDAYYGQCKPLLARVFKVPRMLGLDYEWYIMIAPARNMKCMSENK